MVINTCTLCVQVCKLTLWRNGSASDSRSEGCVFKSRQGQNLFSFFCLLFDIQYKCLFACIITLATYSHNSNLIIIASICRCLRINEPCVVYGYYHIPTTCTCLSKLTLWRNGSASDSRSEGCVFKSRQGQNLFVFFFLSRLIFH